jgi:hypothetical protein
MGERFQFGQVVSGIVSPPLFYGGDFDMAIPQEKSQLHMRNMELEDFPDRRGYNGLAILADGRCGDELRQF